MYLPEQEQAVTETMALLNKSAAEALMEFNPNAVTDVTGFGLLGHGSEIARGSNVSFEISLEKVPVLEGTYELAKNGIVPGGSKANHKWLENEIEYDNLTLEEQLVLCDAITSGGLLVSLSPEEASAYVEKAHAVGLSQATIIGQVLEKKDKLIYVKR